ncbi:hypothetical protein PVAP13_9NG209200 [Panicum virgatum]|uniref:Uncharacterized protein n=1 Tax=Panicum virgatum TaxID=38727 RepID=A0A8T0MI22_PANVG|nr:hypothetical protein PVAP13_9NG209200 [Panicum virgatum]
MPSSPPNPTLQRRQSRTDGDGDGAAVGGGGGAGVPCCVGGASAEKMRLRVRKLATATTTAARGRKAATVQEVSGAADGEDLPMSATPSFFTGHQAYPRPQNPPAALASLPPQGPSAVQTSRPPPQGTPLCIGDGSEDFGQGSEDSGSSLY